MVSGWKKPTLKPPVVEILIFTEKNTDVSNLRQPWHIEYIAVLEIQIVDIRVFTTQKTCKPLQQSVRVFLETFATPLRRVAEFQLYWLSIFLSYWGETCSELQSQRQWQLIRQLMKFFVKPGEIIAWKSDRILFSHNHYDNDSLKNTQMTENILV